MAERVSTAEESAGDKAGQYVVIARRYRPQTFQDLIGQEHVGQALSNAIATSRVGHAYLFTGARGVGKTSTARIFAKALNCVQGPTATPCNVCDTCLSISTGEDVDVLEIDGASNRGIDEIRQLRQNVNIRPSRSRFKIYIIDEVHMLTREAFNALLKTLEEPPEHVKFIFCTTEPGKIPITILSRCQRFDFAGIQSQSIAERLRTIVASEGVEAEAEALQLLARRAAGSMRDSQSLLEQLLAFSPSKITVADVHAMLGTAGEQRLGAMVGSLLSHSPAGAIAELDAAVREGVDPGQLLEQLFGYFRDVMAAAVGCPPEAALYVSSGSWNEAAQLGRQMGVPGILAAMQILDQTLSRMRISTQTRVLAELALVRICQLDDLEDLVEMIGQLRSGAFAAVSNADGGAGAPAISRPLGSSSASPGRLPPPGAEKKNADGAPPRPAAAVTPIELSDANALALWSTALNRVSSTSVELAREFDRVSVDGPNRLVVHFKAEHATAKSICEHPIQMSRFEQSLSEVVGQATKLEFRVDPAKPSDAVRAEPVRSIPPMQRLNEVAQYPLVARAGELFGATPVKLDEPRRTDSTE